LGERAWRDSNEHDGKKKRSTRTQTLVIGEVMTGEGKAVLGGVEKKGGGFRKEGK